jgi:TatD DNase family protein
MKLIDVHCHFDKEFFPDIDDVITRMKENNCIALPVGITPDTNKFVLDLREKYPESIFPCIGLYPPDALVNDKKENSNLIIDYDLENELAFIEKNKDKIVAIGEIGMDYKDGTDKELQEKIFRKQIELAIKLNLPIVVHSRKAEKECIDILEEYTKEHVYRQIVMHCFNGRQAQVRRVRENGWYFSIPTNCVRDTHFQRIIKETPLKQLLTETDSPFLGPFKKDDGTVERNEPINVIETIKKISEIKNTPVEDIANLLHRNAIKLFKIEN